MEETLNKINQRDTDGFKTGYWEENHSEYCPKTVIRKRFYGRNFE